MKKTTIKLIVLGTLVGASVLSTHAYNVQIWSPVQFVKKIFVTPNGELNPAKATIVFDGTNGTIKAKGLYENGQPVATQEYTNRVWNSEKSYTNLKATSVLNSAKSYTDSKVNSVLNSAKSYTDNIERDLVAKIQNSNLNTKHLASLGVSFNKCDSTTVGVRNYKGQTCTQLKYTNVKQCWEARNSQLVYDAPQVEFFGFYSHGWKCNWPFIEEYEKQWQWLIWGRYAWKETRRVGWHTVYGRN